jgi:hypothetical protein
MNANEECLCGTQLLAHLRREDNLLEFFSELDEGTKNLGALFSISMAAFTRNISGRKKLLGVLQLNKKLLGVLQLIKNSWRSAIN